MTGARVAKQGARRKQLVRQAPALAALLLLAGLSWPVLSHANEPGSDFSWGFISAEQRNARYRAAEMELRQINDGYAPASSVMMSCSVTVDATGNRSALQSDGGTGASQSIDENTVGADTAGNRSGDPGSGDSGGGASQSNNDSTLTASVDNTRLLNDVDTFTGTNNSRQRNDINQSNQGTSSIEASASSNEVCTYAPIENYRFMESSAPAAGGPATGAAVGSSANAGSR